MIFDKNNDGTDELFAVTGINWKTNDFSAIRPEIEAAGTSVRGLIGKELFTRAETYYNGMDAGDESVDADLVRRIQAVVGMLAMYRYYQQILSHEDGGRKMKVEETSEKLPWSWMYERDDQALLDKYHRALDELCAKN